MRRGQYAGSYKTAFLKAAIVLVPSYTAAYLTEKMVRVVPTLAAASFFAATIPSEEQKLRRHLDDDVEDIDEVSEVHKETELTEIEIDVEANEVGD